MARYPRGRRNTRLECGCGAPVVKMDGEYVCIDCGTVVTDDDRERRADPVA